MKIKTIHLTLLLLLIAIILASCTGTKSDVATENIPIEPIEDETFIIKFTETEKEYIEILENRGKLLVAMRQKTNVYDPQEDGQIKGFNYLLAKSFTDFLNIDLEVRIVQFNEYFMLDGIVPIEAKEDDSFSFTPDLINEVDIYCDSLTILPWREKLLQFIKTAPVRQLALTRPGEEINSIEEMADKTWIVPRNTSYETRAHEILTEYDMNPEVVYIDNSQDYAPFLWNEIGDVTFRDSTRAIHDVVENGLSLCIPVSDIQYLGWAVRKDNEILASILQKYLDYANSSEVLNDIWYDDFNMTFFEYLKMLDLKE